ncbi:hypothetical protein PM082_010738 [Marasmius tenuissimus]|nr:hypothetical protein PM082_010738 [Marasmius tenuissimus]
MRLFAQRSCFLNPADRTGRLQTYGRTTGKDGNMYGKSRVTKGYHHVNATQPLHTGGGRYD